MSNILSYTLFLPLIGVLILLFIPKEDEVSLKVGALISTFITFLVSLPLLFSFSLGTHEIQFAEKHSWISSLGIQYFIGVDGISILLVLLTTFLTMITVLSSWTSVKTKVKEYFICLLLLETGMLGVFMALDLFLFYVFWEAMLIPMYFLVIIWGGENRVYAALKFFLYTLAGSVLMLVGILALYFKYYSQTGVLTFDILQLMQGTYSPTFQYWVFLSFMLAFAIKVPLFPFHTWLPDTYVEAPTAATVLLAGVMSKTGIYGFIRFGISMFPSAVEQFVPLLSVLGIIGVIYCALIAMMQKDIKRLIAYSSVSHLGIIIVSIFALKMQGVEGGILQMVNHGLITGMLFLCVGVLYERTGSRLIADFGGLAKQLPVFAFFFGLFTLASVGLPGLSAFVGEFLMLVGIFASNKVYGVLCATGVVLGAVYMLWMFQRVMFGQIINERNKLLKDITPREVVCFLPFAVLIVWIGVYPAPFLNFMHKTVEHFIATSKIIM